MTMLTALSVVLAAGLQTAGTRPPPKEAEEPFAVYVFTEVPGDADDGDSLGRTAEEVAKKIRDRKKWFRIVETREEADLVVELLDQATKESSGRTYMRKREGTSRTVQRDTLGVVGFGDIREDHTLLTRVYVPKGEPFEMQAETDGRRPRDAAKPYALRLELFVRQNYWTLMEALEK